MKQHIHHVEIKAWADGAEIEHFDPLSKKWIPISSPWWVHDTKYRVKLQPEVVRYKRFLLRNDGRVGLAVVLGDAQLTSVYPEKWFGFIRWIDNDWQEEVV